MQSLLTHAILLRILWSSDGVQLLNSTNNTLYTETTVSTTTTHITETTTTTWLTTTSRTVHATTILPNSTTPTTCPYDTLVAECRFQNGTEVDALIAEDCILGGQSSQLLVFRTLTVKHGVRLMIRRSAEVDIWIIAGGIKIDGELWVGCSGGDALAFQGRLLLELNGSWNERSSAASAFVVFNWQSEGLPNVEYGSQDAFFPKALLVTNTGRLEFHGKPKASWQRLSATAAKGSRELVLDAPVGWEKGDEIVIGSTSSATGESEIAVVAGVAGRNVTLQKGLLHDHMGSFEGRGAPLNAPVGLRSRNIKVRGRMSEAADAPELKAWEACAMAITSFARTDAPKVKRACFGGHTLYVQFSIIHIENAEFSSMGQAFIMARYPVHWHLAGNATGQYVRNCSLHNNFQRCVTVHGTSDTLVENNVCHDTFGHALYLEDGIETGNAFHRNLVISARPGGAVCTDFNHGDGPRSNTQLGPSGFWITNPDNSFSHNHVVGTGTGYWFTFPMSFGTHCGMAPGAAPSCSQGAGGVFGISKLYFADNRSGYGLHSWWMNQEQARTPVKLFQGNVVTSAYRGIHVDGLVSSSSDSRIPCLSDSCSTCSGPLEGSFFWVPMRFDRNLPVHQRRYSPAVNRIESFYAAHIGGSGESRGIWVSGGLLHVTSSVFLNNFIVAAGMVESSTACLKVTAQSPPGFPLVFEDSLFVAGPLSNTFFQIYDAGIHVVSSRWILADGTAINFFVAKPKRAFGGNGNPVYFENSSALINSGSLTPRHFAWAKRIFQEKPLASPLRSAVGQGSASLYAKIADFRGLAWGSPYIKGSYIYSSDSFGMGARVPAILAAAKDGENESRFGNRVQFVQGVEACADYLQGSLPRFFCGRAFGTYGRWCGSGIQLQACPGVAKQAPHWFRSLQPWSEMNWTSFAAFVAKTGTKSKVKKPDASPLVLPRGNCSFAAEPPVSTPFVWDIVCKSGGLGCNADGQHNECRWCGFGSYRDCPRVNLYANESNNEAIPADMQKPAEIGSSGQYVNESGKASTPAFLGIDEKASPSQIGSWWLLVVVGVLVTCISLTCWCYVRRPFRKNSRVALPPREAFHDPMQQATSSQGSPPALESVLIPSVSARPCGQNHQITLAPSLLGRTQCSFMRRGRKITTSPVVIDPPDERSPPPKVQ